MQTIVLFNIHYDTLFGDKILVIGSTKDLGEWDVQKAIPLVWN
jgi:hypothetical protein